MKHKLSHRSKRNTQPSDAPRPGKPARNDRRFLPPSLRFEKGNRLVALMNCYTYFMDGMAIMVLCMIVWGLCKSALAGLW